jgi:hypothetical protein
VEKIKPFEMKRVFIGLITLTLMGSYSAQNLVQEVAKAPMLEIETAIAESHGDFVPPALTRGDVLFMETFSNGYDGDNGIGPMVPVDNSAGGDEIWKIAPMDGTPPNFTGFGSLALNSATSSGGYAWLDAYGYHVSQGSPSPFISIEASLATPSLDLSATSSVILQYTQRFAYCCFSFSPLTVEVSVDGGSSWTVFPGHGEFLPDANTNSGNITTLLDISCVAAGEADVIVRFGYSIGDTGFGFYSWAIDDISIFEGAVDNDIAISQITNGDVAGIWEYRVTPIQQAIPAADGGVEVDVMFANRGNLDQTNVVFTVDFLDAGGTSVYTFTNDPIDVPSSGNSLLCPYISDTLRFFTGFEPDEIGDYTIRVTAEGDQTDGTPENNVVDKTIEFNNHTYGHDDDSMLDIEYRPENADGGGFERIGFANMFTVPNEGSEANGAMVRFGPNTDPETTIEVRLLEFDPSAFNPNPIDQLAVVYTEYETTEDDIPSSLSTSFDTWIEFDDTWTLSPDLIYMLALVTIDEVSSPTEITMMGQSLSDTDFSTRIVALSGDQVPTWFSDQGTPAIRLTMDSDPTGVEELEALNVSLDQNMPNPATGITTIQFALEEALDVDFQVVDNMGRIVYSERMGKLVPGQHQIVLDASEFAPGIYQYALISEGRRSTKSMVISK